MTIKSSDLDDIKPVSNSLNKLKKSAVFPWKTPTAEPMTNTSIPTETQQKHNSNSIETYQKPNNDITKAEHKHNNNPTSSPTETQQKHNSNPTETYQKPNNDITKAEHKHNNNPTSSPTNNPTSSATVGLLEKHKTLPIKRNIELLNGIKKRFLLYVFFKCLKNGSRISENISLIEAAASIGTKHKTLETIVTRLVKEAFILRGGFTKKGPGGYSHFEIPEDIYKQIISNESFQRDSQLAVLNNIENSLQKPNNNITVTLQKHNNNPTNNPTSSATMASSSMYVGTNNTIHTESQNEDTVKDEWSELSEIDFSILAPWKISSSIIEQIKKNQWHLTRYQLEDFIERFVIYFTEADYAERSKDIQRPYSFFLSSIKMISAGQPDSICDVKTKAEIAQEMAIKNRITRLEKEKKDRELLNEKAECLRHGEFEKWYEPLSENERTSLVPPVPAAPYGSPRYKSVALGYFTENIWPPIKNALIYGHTN
jgi:hypothetical protein